MLLFCMLPSQTRATRTNDPSSVAKLATNVLFTLSPSSLLAATDVPQPQATHRCELGPAALASPARSWKAPGLIYLVSDLLIYRSDLCTRRCTYTYAHCNWLATGLCFSTLTPHFTLYYPGLETYTHVGASESVDLH